MFLAMAWDRAQTSSLSAGPRPGPLIAATKAEVLAFAAFPRAQWRKI